MFKKFIIYFFLYILTIWIVLSVFFLAPKEIHRFVFLRLIIILFATTLLIKYFIYMVVSPWYDVFMAKIAYNQNKIKKSKNYNPKVTVLVPAWNEEGGILTTLKSLLQSSYKNLEIVVIDNASTDKTQANVEKLIRDYYKNISLNSKQNIDIVLTKELKQGKGNALNKGISIARGDIIVSIDADCFVMAETVKNFVKYFENPKVVAVVGNVKIGNTKSILEVVQYLEFLFSFYFKKCDSILGSIYIIGGAAGAFRKEVFNQIGDYSTVNITEDIDLSFRIQLAGMKIVYAEDAVVYTEGATDFKGLIKQRLRWKRGRLETFLNHRQMFFSTKKIHRKILSWFILPLAIFGDLQLFLELFFIIFVYIYSYLTSDYSSFISGIVVVTSMFIVQVLFDVREKKRGNLFLLAPIGWLLLYVSTFVEFSALIKTILGYLKKEELKWQTWNRKGVFSEEISEEIVIARDK